MAIGKCCKPTFPDRYSSFLPLPTNRLVYQDSGGSTFFFRNWISTKALPKSAISPRYLVYTSSLPKVQTRKSGEFFWAIRHVLSPNFEFDQLSFGNTSYPPIDTPTPGFKQNRCQLDIPGARHPNHGFLGPQSSSFFAVWANSSAWNLLQAPEILKSSQTSVVRCLFFSISRGFWGSETV